MEILVILVLGKLEVTQEDECAWERGLVLGIEGRAVLLESTCWGTWPLSLRVAHDLEKIRVSQARLRLYPNHFPTEGREDRRPPV